MQWQREQKPDFRSCDRNLHRFKYAQWRCHGVRCCCRHCVRNIPYLFAVGITIPFQKEKCSLSNRHISHSAHKIWHHCEESRNVCIEKWFEFRIDLYRFVGFDWGLQNAHLANKSMFFPMWCWYNHISKKKKIFQNLKRKMNKRMIKSRSNEAYSICSCSCIYLASLFDIIKFN